MKKCCSCEEVKDYKLFYVNNASPDGYFGKCKQCFIKGKNCSRGRKSLTEKELISLKYSRKESFNDIRLVRTSKLDYVETYRLLKKMGYSLSKSIHEQFCEKHGLTPTEPKEFNFYFSPEDLGMK